MQVAALIDRGSVTGLQIAVVAVCCILNMIDGFDVLAISFAAPSIAREWQITPQSLGLVFSAGLVGMALGAMFIAPLTDRIGRRAMIIACLVAISCAMAATGMVRSLGELLAARLVTGLGIGSMLASLTAMVAEYTPDRHRNLSVALLQAGYPVGGTLGGFLAAWIVPEFGWRAVFYWGAVLGALMVPLSVIALPESLQFLIEKRPTGALSKANRILARLGQPAAQALPAPASAPEAAAVSTLLSAARRRNTLLLWSAFFLNSLAIYFVFSWVPKIAVDSGLALDKSILAGALMNAGGVVGIITLGHLSGTRGLRPLILAFLVLGAASLVLYGQLPPNPALLMSVGFVVGFLIMGGFIGLYAAAARIYPTEIRVTGIGWTIGVGRIGAIIGPYLGGVLIALQWSTTANFAIFAVPVLLAGLAAYALRVPGSAQLEGKIL